MQVDLRSPADTAKSSKALAEAYVPIIRGFLVPCAIYYTYVTWGHWQDEHGPHLAALAGLSACTVVLSLVMWRWLRNAHTASLRRVELVGMVTSLLIYSNVSLYMLLSFQEAKLIYFVLMAVVFAISGVTMRGALVTVGLSIGTLFWFAARTPGVALGQYVAIGAATSFAAFGMSYLMRKALRQQVSARLKADTLTERAQHYAATDMLTALPSRRQVFDDIDAEVKSGRSFWLGLIDLDGFKAINDAYGHALGDELLQQVAVRVREFLGDGTRFGRLGGDEFGWLLPGELSRLNVEEAARDLIMAISQPYVVGNRRVHIGATVGFCHCPTMARDSTDVYEHADYALYAAKDGRRGDVLVFSGEHMRAMSDASALERALREADIESEFHMQFQPQFSTSSGRIVGFEALARWTSPTVGPVRPDQFIAAAERSGKIVELTPALLRKALAEAATWPEDLLLSFNLSANDLADPLLAPSLLSAIDASGVAPLRVQFELTETSVMRDVTRSKAVLEQLAAAGCSIALDDFGSGYSSFGYLNQLRLDTLKIDRSFVRSITASTVSREVVAGMLRLANALHLNCVVEGVETKEELDLLVAMGADVIQGYLFGAPVDAGQIPSVLQSTAAAARPTRSAIGH